MVPVHCEVCARQAGRPWIGVVFLMLLSLLRWCWSAPSSVFRFARQQPPVRRPRLCFLAGSRARRTAVARAVRPVLAELARFESPKALVDLVVVQDRLSRPDGEALRVAVHRTRRGTTVLLTIRLALHARGACYGPEALAATLADTLVALYERESQVSSVLEVPARTARETPVAAPTPATGPSPSRPAQTRGARTSVFDHTTVLARARADDEADGTITQFQPRPGGPSTNAHA